MLILFPLSGCLNNAFITANLQSGFSEYPETSIYFLLLSIGLIIDFKKKKKTSHFNSL